MTERKQEILYSEPVREIMGKPPRFMLRWGATIVFAVFVLFILFAWLIRYPDTIPAPVEITTENPPVTLVSKITGHINSLYAREKDTIKAGRLVALMETTARLSEIETLKNLIDTINHPELLSENSLPLFSALGEMQETYSVFLKNLSNLNSYVTNDIYGNRIIALSDEVKSIVRYIDNLRSKEKLHSENQRIEAKKFRRDSLLFVNSVLAESDIDGSRQALLKVKMDLQQVRLELASKNIELAQKNQLLQDYRITDTEEKNKLIFTLRESFLNLRAGLNIWESTYMLVSPVDGVVSFTKYWSANQSVIKDEPVVNIVPLNAGNYLGRINLRMLRSGKVKTGQTVNIKLSGYPYLEYGMVRGRIRSISLVPSGDSYIIEIGLPDGLTTLYGRKLDFTQNMQGTAEIITENIRLLNKVINPFRYMITRNRK
jgi:multidrug resistance efflux pump